MATVSLWIAGTRKTSSDHGSYPWMAAVFVAEVVQLRYRRDAVYWVGGASLIEDREKLFVYNRRVSQLRRKKALLRKHSEFCTHLDSHSEPVTARYRTSAKYLKLWYRVLNGDAMYDQCSAEGTLNHAYYMIASRTRNLAPDRRAKVYSAVLDIVDAVVPAGYTSSVNVAFKKRLQLAAAKSR